MAMARVPFISCAVFTSLARGITLHRGLSASGLVDDGESTILNNDAVESATFEGYLAKAVWAMSARSIDAASAWKTQYLGVEDDRQPHDCGSNSRFIISNFTLGTPLFGLHGVHAAGVSGARSHTSGEISVERMEDILDEVIDGGTYSPWMDNHFALYRYDIQSLISKFRAGGQTFLVLSWDADGLTFYSVIAHVPKSQEIYEFISPQKPTNVDEIVHFPVARHYFGGRFQIRAQDNRNVPLHMSQTTRDLTHAVKFFKDVLGLDPVEQTTFDGGRYAIYNLTTDMTSTDGTTSDLNMQYGQVQLWERDDAKLGSHSPAWFDEYVENATFADYSGSLKTCFNVWGDNHFTFYAVSSDFIRRLVARYEERGLPYKEFSMLEDWAEGFLFSSYFMLPGGRWIELHPKEMRPGTIGSEVWDTDYCYTQSCS